MPTLVFDIETIGENFDDMDVVTQKMLTRWVRHGSLSDEAQTLEIENIKNGLGFLPLTGEIVAIGMLDYEKNKSAVYFQALNESFGNFEEDGTMYKQMTEAQMLEAFWRVCENYDQFVTFNGRGFDAPFLATRSAIHRIRPSKDLLSNRYLGSQKFGAKHFDLQDPPFFLRIDPTPAEFTPRLPRLRYREPEDRGSGRGRCDEVVCREEVSRHRPLQCPRYRRHQRTVRLLGTVYEVRTVNVSVIANPDSNRDVAIPVFVSLLYHSGLPRYARKDDELS